LQCFSCGAELGLHKRHHNYRVRTGNGVPVFTGVPSAIAVAGGNVLKGDASSSDAGTSDDADTMATSAGGWAFEDSCYSPVECVYVRIIYRSRNSNTNRQ
jgi:hypothetical protein